MATMMTRMMKMTQNSDKDMPFLYDKYITRIRNRLIRRNKNWIALVCGETGSGKSYSAAKLAQDIDPTFLDSVRDEGLKSRVSVGSKEDFINIVKMAKDGKLKRGNVIIFDEAGVSISCRTWFAEAQQELMNILQSFRNMNLGTIFTTPNASFIDSQARRLMHAYLEALKIDYKRNRVIMKPFNLKPNHFEGDIYKIYPWFNGIQMTRLFVAKPAKDYIKVYEPEKNVLLTFLIQEAEAKMEVNKRKEKQKRLFDSDIMKEIKEKQIPLDAYALQFRFNIGKDRAYRIISNYEKLSPTI